MVLKIRSNRMIQMNFYLLDYLIIKYIKIFEYIYGIKNSYFIYK